jgi:orotate phosphoribosyltransferase
LSRGEDIAKIGFFYAQAIINLNLKFDVLFGTAYKGIPIVVATSIALKNQYNLDIPYSFNRKEEKKYGEKGCFVGVNIKNRKIIILDDVITSGMSINHAIKIVEKEKAEISSIFVLLDRKEKRDNNLCTTNNSQNKKIYKINSIITIDDFIFYLSEQKKLKKYAHQLIKYRKEYTSSLQEYK